MWLLWVVPAETLQTSRTVSRSQAMYIKAPYELPEYFTAIIADELNVKEVKFTDNIENFISYSFKPQLKTV